MRVKAIATQLLALGYTDVFAYNMPAELKSAILVVSWVPAEIHPDIYGYRIGEFTVVVRDPNYETGIALSKEIGDALTGEGQTLSGVYFMFIRAKHEPMVFPRSEGNGVEFAVNYQCRFID